MEHEDDSGAQQPERPWIALHTTYDVEAWIDSYNRDLQRAVTDRNKAAGCGICFILAHGGEIYLHTDSEGGVLLDVTPAAEWAAPLITAATRVAAPAGRIWSVPGHALTQLVLGLSPLIAATRIVPRHDFRLRKF